MRRADNLRYKLKTASVTEKLIGINVGVFVLFYVFRAITYMLEINSDLVLEWLVFPADPAEFIFKPWTIITYAFLHGGIWHILSNMLILYYAGVYFLNYFSPKKLLNFFFLGAIWGAVIFSFSYNLFPAFSGAGKSYLMGASAGVMAVLVGIATHIPNMRIRLILIGSIKFWWIAAFMVVLDIVQIPISNPGGHLAHLGGAAFGYVYAKQLGRGNDIGKGFEKVMDWIASLFSSEPRVKKSPLKTVHRRKNPAGTNTKTTYNYRSRKNEEQEKIDAILDKISKSGYDSLSKQEKDFLFNAGKSN